MEKYFELLKQGGSDLAIKIDAKTISVAAWTVFKCMYGCPHYGRTHCCPPKAPTWQMTRDMLSCFKYGILFRCHDLKAITPLALKASRELLLDGYYKTIAFGGGPCTKCEKCNPDYCIHPLEILPSMEACGIDVFATVKANGLEIGMARDKDTAINCYGLIMVE